MTDEVNLRVALLDAHTYLKLKYITEIPIRKVGEFHVICASGIIRWDPVRGFTVENRPLCNMSPEDLVFLSKHLKGVKEELDRQVKQRNPPKFEPNKLLMPVAEMRAALSKVRTFLEKNK